MRQRSVEKNAHLHALLHQIAEQKEWRGEKLDIETWKRLLTAAYERAHGRQAEFYPAVDGTGFDVVYRRTSRMTQEEIRDLIYWIEAWAIDNGVTITMPDREAA